MRGLIVMIDPDQYDGFATYQELNLTKEEIENLRIQKQEISKRARAILQKRMNKMKHPANDFEFNEDAEVSFNQWFNDDYGSYSFRNEYFYGDCLIEDEKTRQDMMYKWVHSAFSYAYQKGVEDGMKLYGGTE